MVTKKIWTIGSLIFALLVSTGVLYVTFDDVKIRLDEDKTRFYNLQESRWRTIATEYTKIYDGTSLAYRDASDIKIETITGTDTTIFIRTTPYKNGPKVISTYVFDGSVNDVELVPIKEIHEIINGSGYIFQYEVRDLKGIEETYKLSGETELQFGRIKITLDDRYYWGTVYKSGIVKVRYKPSSDYEIYNIRLFDPAGATILDDFNINGYLDPTYWYANSTTGIAGLNVTVSDSYIYLNISGFGAAVFVMLNNTKYTLNNYSFFIEDITIRCNQNVVQFYMALVNDYSTTTGTFTNRTNIFNHVQICTGGLTETYSNWTINSSGSNVNVYTDGILNLSTDISSMGYKKYLIFMLQENNNIKSVRFDKIYYNSTAAANTAPTVTLNNPATNNITNHNNPTFNVTCVDAESTVLNITLYLNDIPFGTNHTVLNGTPTYFKPNASLDIKTYRWNSSCSDTEDRDTITPRYIHIESNRTDTFFTDSFETGTVTANWTKYSSNSTYGNISVRSVNPSPFDGTYNLLMDVYFSGTNNLNELITNFSLANKGNLSLSLYKREFSDEDHTCPAFWNGHQNCDGIAITCGNDTWYNLYNLTGSNYYYEIIYLNISKAGADYCGGTINSSFKIKMQQYDNYKYSTDGIAFDLIKLYGDITTPPGEDTTPTVNPMSPATANTTTDTTPDFIFNFTDDNSTANCTLLINSTPYGTNHTTLNNTKTTITANATLTANGGTYYWNISCNDTNNLGWSATRTIDIVGPTSNFTWAFCGNISWFQFSPDLATYYNGTSKTITAYNITPNNHSVDETCDINISNTGGTILNISAKINQTDSLFVVKFNRLIMNTTYQNVITNLAVGTNDYINITIDYIGANRSFQFNWSINST